MIDDTLDDWIEAASQRSSPFVDADEFVGVCGPALSTKDVDVVRESLALWHDVDRFKTKTNELCARCTGSDWFGRPHLKFLHDAFVLSRFAFDEHCDAVRLADAAEQWPDGYVRHQSRLHNIEIVSTHGGRKLGSEYAGKLGLQVDPVSDWVKRADSIPFYLDQAIRKKVLKKYSAPCWLVVYLNIDEWGIRHEQTVEHIRRIRGTYLAHFESITVRWKGCMY